MKKVLQEKLAIDKTNWTPVKFGDVVFEPKESTNTPLEDGIEHVVGLEHIETENIHLKQSASIEEATTFTKKFIEKDVLFGRRRAYLKKAAQASFSGICSGDITVFRAKENLMPELLPFIVNNEKFFDYAVKHSAGGLSPRVKFKDLAKYEFLLPPKDQQAQLSELLWAMDEVIEREKEVLGGLKINFHSYRKSFIENGTSLLGNVKKIRFGEIFKEWKTLKLQDFCKLIGGNAFKSSSFKTEGEFQVLRIGNLTNEGFNLSKSPVFVDSFSAKEEKYLIPKGAVVLSLTGTNGKRDYGFPSLMKVENKHLLNQRLVMILTNNNIMRAEFLFLLSKLELFQGRFFLNATGTANQANVSIQDVSEIELPVPSLDEQDYILERIEKCRLAIRDSKAKVMNSLSLQKSLINQIF